MSGASADERAWLATLAAGAVVLVVVTALLELLRRTVRDVEDGVDEVWLAGKRVAQNTQTTHMLQTTRARGIELRDELARHAELLDGGVR